MTPSAFSRRASALLLCTTALAFVHDPAPAQAQETERVAATWVAEAVDQVAPAVVMVEAGPASAERRGLQIPDDRTIEDFLRRFGNDGHPGIQLPQFGGESGPRTGSGFVVDASGLFVTASALVAGADSVKVTLGDGATRGATLVGSDPESGIAVLRIDAEEPLSTLDWGEAGALGIGSEVAAIGRSAAFGATAWTGRLAAMDATGERLLIDDPLGPSAIGAPLLGPDGTVVGVAGVGGQVDAGASIALSSAAARDIVDELSSDGAISRGYLGVQIQAVTQELAEALGLDTAEGALVTSVQPGAPAETAGIREGDVILGLDGGEVAGPEDLSRRVSALEPGETVRLELWRGNERTELEVELAAAPGADPRPEPPAGTEVSELGLTVTEITPEVRDQFAIPDAVSGVAVLGVGENVPPEVLIQEGDVIVGVQREQVASVPDLRRALERVQAEGRNAALLLVQRGQERRFLAVPMRS